MTKFPSTIVQALAASAFFSGTSLSLSPFSSKSSTTSAKTTSAITDLMHEAAVAETERLFQFYSSNGNYNTENTENNNYPTKIEASPVITSPPTVWRSSEEAVTYIRDNIDTVLFDCDGVLYRTTSLCPGASECIRELMEIHHKRVLFVTNNAGVNRRELREKLSRLLRIDSLTNDQMISSSYSSAQYLKSELMAASKELGSTTTASSTPPRVHVIGSSGLCEELVAAGFNVTGGPSTSSPEHDECCSMSREELAAYDFEQLHPIDALVVGHDTDLNFRKLCIAENLLLRNPEALFVATNKDSFDVVDGNNNDLRHIMGNGATVVALEYSSKRTAINVGKPSKELFGLIRNQDSSGAKKPSGNVFDDPSRCLFVGDRLDTDIRFGKDNGMKSLLVMTGVTSAKTMEELANGTEEEPLPDFILPHVGMLI
ncbi:unnamed protein product [Pseudo-nitzschia multistriata]|uniref:Uncharacterized protein n=1 Tax=Pseudo-nitzschia multistriata TaxID=183589 RepID=A0A448YU68_9STRA|nr:unnamed protein product [Pseudo-nitzschia multistriata]